MKLGIRFVSLLVTVGILLVELSSFYVKTNNETSIDAPNESVVRAIVASILESLEESEKDTTDEETQEGNQENTDIEGKLFGLDYEYYVNNTETNVYALLKNELSILYHTFSAKLVLSNGDEILGIAFTDFQNPYVNEETETICFPTGFICAIDEPAIPLEEYELGLEIVDLECEESNDCKFIYTHTMEAFSRHSVFLGKYVRYGVNDEGAIWFDETEYTRGYCDESLGALYSYDEGRFVYDPGVGEYVPITGESISQCIDYVALEAEVNRILREQDYNFSSTDVTTAINISQIAVIDYLMSMSEETFMGYNVSDLINIAKELDPSTCIETTPSGLVVVNIAEAPPEEPTELVKWMTGICCGVAIVGGVALSCLGNMPQFIALKGVGGAIIGASMEIAIEVIIENKALSEVDYRKVVISAVAGAISAYVGIFVDAVIGGVVESVFTLMDGGSLGDAAISFALGTVTGLALSVAFNLASEAMVKLVKKVPLVKKALKFVDNLTDDAIDYLMRKVGAPIGDEPSKLWDLLASVKSRRLAKKFGGTFIDADFIDGLPEKNFINTLRNNAPKYENWDIFDIDGVTKLTREQYENIAKKNGNYVLKLKGEALEIAQARYGKNLTSITYIAGQPQIPNFGGVRANITPNRKLNFEILDETFAKGIREGTVTLSDEIKNYFIKKGIDPSKVTKSQITKMRKGSELGLTWHEVYDPVLGVGAVLVDSKLHSKLSHVGGRKEAEILASTVSYINQFFKNPIRAN